MFLRVTEANARAFQLRPGEKGISVFESESVEPSLEETELLECFREGSQIVTRTTEEIQAKGLTVVQVTGAETLPTRLIEAHYEIRPGENMTRAQFKAALKELE